MPPVKLTSPLLNVDESTLEYDVPGPSYPVGPNGQPAGVPANCPEQIPSPSKANGCVVPVSDSWGMVAVLLFWTPTRVSSMPSYGPWPLSTTVTVPSGLMVR